MAKDEAYRIAEKKIEEAYRSGARDLDLSGRYEDEKSLGLTELPESLGQLTQLQTLNLSYQQLAVLPEWIGHFTQLKALDLSRNQLVTLPKSIGQFAHLQILEIGDNQR